MFTAALPWWAANGLDRKHGGYVEQMTLDGRDAAVPFKRTRVTARQIYVFSHGFMLGFEKGVDLARHGFDFLVSKTWQGPDKGFVRTLTREGAPLDPTPDLYDLAFVLFAFAWFHRATKEKPAREWMHRTLDFIEAKLRAPGGEGFLHELPRKDSVSRTRTCTSPRPASRRMNPRRETLRRSCKRAHRPVPQALLRHQERHAGRILQQRPDPRAGARRPHHRAGPPV